MAQRSLECSYKAVLGSLGIVNDSIEHPSHGREGHNLPSLLELMRDKFGSPHQGNRTRT